MKQWLLSVLPSVWSFCGPTICFTGCSSYILVQLFVPCFLSVVLWRGNYTRNQWWKLAGYMLLVTTVIFVIVLFGFVWDWHDIGGRPANLPPDVGTYITNNELVGILILLWVIVAPILSCVISYITKLIIKYNVGGKARH